MPTMPKKPQRRGKTPIEVRDASSTAEVRLCIGLASDRRNKKGVQEGRLVWNVVWESRCSHAGTKSQSIRENQSRESVATFAKANTLSGSFPEEVQLGTSDHRTSLDFDLFDLRRVYRELAFYTFTGNDASYDEHFARARPAASDDGSGENLNAFFVAFLDLRVDVDRIANPKLVYVFLQVSAFNGFKDLLAHDQTFCRAIGKS